MYLSNPISAGGWGNAGGGAIFYAIPAVMTSLVANQGLSISSAWRTSFLVLPLGMLVTVAIAILALGDDCPQGKWENRYIAPVEGITPSQSSLTLSDTNSSDKTVPAAPIPAKTEWRTVLKIVTSPQTMLVALPYICTFGAELAVEGVISHMYAVQSRRTGLNWDESLAGKYASIFGLLNIITRPLGGVISDFLYKSRPVYVKKYWMLFLGIAEGAFFMLVGFLPNMDVFQLIGVLSCVAVTMEMGNGANYALVPHIFPQRNGFVSGVVGACGNLGGIIFSLIFRYNPNDTFKAMWISGVIVLILHFLVLFVPVPESPAELQDNEKKKPLMVQL